MNYPLRDDVAESGRQALVRTGRGRVGGEPLLACEPAYPSRRIPA